MHSFALAILSQRHLLKRGLFYSLESESRSVVSYSSVTPWTVAHQVPLPMEFSRQEHWSGLPIPPPEDIPDPGIGPRSPAWQADS